VVLKELAPVRAAELTGDPAPRPDGRRDPERVALASWIEDHGYRMTGYHREVYLDYCPDRAGEGGTELRLPVVGRLRWLASEMKDRPGLLACLRGRSA